MEVSIMFNRKSLVIFFITFISLTLVATIFGYYYFDNSYKHITDEIQVDLKQTATNIEDTFLNKIIIESRYVLSISSYPETMSEEQFLSNKTKLFYEMMSVSKQFDQLRYIDETGMETIRINNLDQGPYIVPAGELQNKETREYFIDTKSLNEYDIYY